jgi:hypothetical protein
MFQENRTPDNLFHDLQNADIADSGVNSQGRTLPLTPVALSAPYDLDHSHAAFLAYNGRTDGGGQNPPPAKDSATLVKAFDLKFIHL